MAAHETELVNILRIGREIGKIEIPNRRRVSRPLAKLLASTSFGNWTSGFRWKWNIRANNRSEPDGLPFPCAPGQAGSC